MASLKCPFCPDYEMRSDNYSGHMCKHLHTILKHSKVQVEDANREKNVVVYYKKWRQHPQADYCNQSICNFAACLGCGNHLASTKCGWSSEYSFACPECKKGFNNCEGRECPDCGRAGLRLHSVPENDRIESFILKHNRDCREKWDEVKLWFKAGAEPPKFKIVRTKQPGKAAPRKKLESKAASVVAKVDDRELRNFIAETFDDTFAYWEEPEKPDEDEEDEEERERMAQRHAEQIELYNELHSLTTKEMLEKAKDDYEGMLDAKREEVRRLRDENKKLKNDQIAGVEAIIAERQKDVIAAKTAALNETIKKLSAQIITLKEDANWEKKEAIQARQKLSDAQNQVLEMERNAREDAREMERLRNELYRFQDFCRQQKMNLPWE